MSARVEKDPESEEDEGYVKIRYQQPNLRELEIPIDDNGDLPWKLVRALNPKIIGLSIQSKEKERIMKIKNDVIQEPKKGWKSFTVIALLEEPDENVVEEPVRSICRCDVSGASKIEVKTEKENVPAKDLVKSVNVSAKPSNPNTTTLLADLVSIAQPINSISTNSSSVQSTVDDDESVADHRTLTEEDSSDEENSSSVHSTEEDEDATNEENSDLDNSSLPGFSTNTQTSQQYFDECKDAFIHRISEQNLKIRVEDPLFLDRILFMKKHLWRYSLPESLNPKFGNCLVCEKTICNVYNYINHIFSINHIRNALSQENMDWVCKLLSFIQNDENGYQIKLPLLKRKADDAKTNGDTVTEKKSKNI